jgi:hypothetical protein
VEVGNLGGFFLAAGEEGFFLWLMRHLGDGREEDEDIS